MHSTFTDKLQALIDRQGDTIYGFSKRTGLDRSNIHKVLSGERTPSAMFVLRLLDTLDLPEAEKKALIFDYAESSLLEQEVQAQLLIQDIFGKLRQEADTPADAPALTLPAGASIAVGQAQISAVMAQILAEIGEGETLHATIPFLNRSAFLRPLWEVFSERSVHIRHLVRFAGEAVYDLEILSNLLPFVVSEHRGYRARCFYGDQPPASAPSPLYLLTARCVVCFSAEMDRAVIHRDPALLAFFVSSFDADATQAAQLFEVYADGVNNLIGYKEMDDRITHTLTYSPCFARVYTRDIVQRKIREDLPQRDAIVEATIAYLTKTVHAEAELQMMTMAGLSLFLREGRLSILPDDYVNAFTPPERRVLLEGLLAETGRGLSLRIVDPDKLHTPEGLFIALNDQGRICFHFVHPKDKSIQCLMLHDTKLLRLVKTFLLNMERRGFVLGEAQTLEILQGYLDEGRIPG